MEISRNQHEEVKAHHDVIIIGAGLAGLTVAIEVAKYRDVLVLVKNELTLNASAWAQGGIVGVLDKKDSFELHVADTLEAGAGIAIEAAARYLTQNSASTIAWLLDQGVLFTPDSAGPLGLHLTCEGGHTHRRILHAIDSTGRVIHQALLTKARAHPRIQFLEHWIALDLIIEKPAKNTISIKSPFPPLYFKVPIHEAIEPVPLVPDGPAPPPIPPFAKTPSVAKVGAAFAFLLNQLSLPVKPATEPPVFNSAAL